MNGYWKVLYTVEDCPDVYIELHFWRIRRSEDTLWKVGRIVSGMTVPPVETKFYKTYLTNDILNNPNKYFQTIENMRLNPNSSTLMDNSDISRRVMIKNDDKQTFFQKFSSILGLGGRKKAVQEEDLIKEVEETKEAAMEAIRAVIKKEKTRERREKVMYRAKYKAKHDAKRNMKKRFRIGNRYILRIKPKDGSREVVMGFECKKFIYTMNEILMNIVIMKQVYGDEGRKFTLDRHECRKFHVKYEPGLEVWPMDMNWIPEKKQIS